MKFNRNPEEDYNLQLTPLIDVVFLLLIFFMVSTAFIDFSRRMDIELPESSAGAAMEKVKVFEIEINTDKEVTVNGVPTTMDELSVLLNKKDPSIVKRSAVVRADRGLDYGYVVKIMTACQEAGIADIGLAVQ